MFDPRQLYHMTEPSFYMFDGVDLQDFFIRPKVSSHSIKSGLYLPFPAENTTSRCLKPAILLKLSLVTDQSGLF